MDQLLKDLTFVFRDVLDDDSIVLKEETTAAEIEEWDSLTHIMIISEIEKKFKKPVKIFLSITMGFALCPPIW